MRLTSADTKKRTEVRFKALAAVQVFLNASLRHCVCLSDVSVDRCAFTFRVKQSKYYIPLIQHDHKNEGSYRSFETSKPLAHRQCHIPDNKDRTKRRHLYVVVAILTFLISKFRRV